MHVHSAMTTRTLVHVYQQPFNELDGICRCGLTQHCYGCPPHPGTWRVEAVVALGLSPALLPKLLVVDFVFFLIIAIPRLLLLSKMPISSVVNVAILRGRPFIPVTFSGERTARSGFLIERSRCPLSLLEAMI